MCIFRATEGINTAKLSIEYAPVAMAKCAPHAKQQENNNVAE
jgi:hypothetical protein